MELRKNTELQELLSRYDSEEVKQLLFPNGSNTEFNFLDKIETITGSDPIVQMQIHYNRNGKVKQVLVDNKFDVAKSLKEINETLIDHGVLNYTQKTAYSTSKLRGFYRLENYFQILPIKTTKDRYLLVDAGEPFRLECSFMGSPNLFINRKRAERQVHEWGRLLNILLRDSVHLGRRYSSEEWFYDYTTQKNETAFVGYIDNTLESLADSFSRLDGVSEAEISSEPDYYKRMLLTTGEEMVFPSNLSALVSAYIALDSDVRKSYQLALSWYADAQKIFSISSSACFNALATSIECMLDNDSENCGECSQPKYGIGKKFNKFLLDYVPVTDSTDPAKIFKDLYSSRSSMVHGSSKYSHDLFSDYGGYKTARDKHELRLMINIVKIAMINWLSSKI